MYNIARSRSQNFFKISLLFFRQMEAKWNNNSGFAFFVFSRFDAKVELQNWALVLMWNKEFTIIFFLLLPSKLLNCIYIISVRYMINSRTSKWWLKQNIFWISKHSPTCDINRFPRKFWWIFILELWENGHGLYSRPEKICVPAGESIASLPHHDQQRQRPIKFLQRGRRKFQPDYCLIPTFTCLCCSIKEGHELNVYM